MRYTDCCQTYRPIELMLLGQMKTGSWDEDYGVVAPTCTVVTAKTWVEKKLSVFFYYLTGLENGSWLFDSTKIHHLTPWPIKPVPS